MRSQFLRISVVATVLTIMMSLSLAQASPVTLLRTTLTPPPPTSTAVSETLVPLVMLTIYDPWRMVIGSDEPAFVLYDSGLVIYQRIGPADAPEFVSVQLSAADLEVLKLNLGLNKDLYVLEANQDYYAKTDQPTNVIWLHDPVLGDKRISIYGDLWHDEEARRLAAPQPLIDLFDTLTTYSHPQAELWLPDHFEVMLWPYDTTDAAAWPSDWPGLDDDSTIKRQSVYSVYIHISDYQRYLTLRNTAQAVRLDGRTWAFAMRFPMPHERATS